MDAPDYEDVSHNGSRSPSPARWRRSRSPSPEGRTSSRSDSVSRSYSPRPTGRRQAHPSPSPSAEARPLVPISLEDLPIFPYIGTRDVTLPLELLDEPYTPKLVTGDQIELRVVRPKFLFEITRWMVRVVVGRETVLDAEDHLQNNELPLAKNRTQCSVLNIYDTYGLDITYAFLKYIYENKFYHEHDRWLLVYLQGSYFHMIGRTLDIATEMDGLDAVPALMTSILLELLVRERAEFKLHYELKQVPGSHIPPEIVSRMIGSNRISKAVTKGVRSARCTWIPTALEVAGWSDSPVTYLLEDGSFCSINSRSEEEGNYASSILLTRTSDIFHIIEEVADRAEHLSVQLGRGERITCESLHSYFNFFHSKGCNTQKSMLLLLSDLRARLLPITERNVTEACAWIVQLTMDSGEDRDTSSYTMKDLSVELEHLISYHERKYR